MQSVFIWSFLFVLVGILTRVGAEITFPCPVPAQPEQHAIPDDQLFVPHPEYQSEWYYVTGALCSSDDFGVPSRIEGRNRNALVYGSNSLSMCVNPVAFQLTTFMRNVTLSDGSTVIFTDSVVAVTTPQDHYALSSIGGGPIYPSQAQPFDLIYYSPSPESMIEYRALSGTPGSIGSQYHFVAKTANLSLDLSFQSISPLMYQGVNGYAGTPNADYCLGNYYISMPKMYTSGVITLNNKKYSVSGDSWFDQEWGTATAPKDKMGGWVWLGLRVGNASLMLTVPRQNHIPLYPYSTVNILYNDNEATMLHGILLYMKPLSTWTSPHSNITYPLSYYIYTSIPDAFEISITPVFLDQEVLEPTFNPPQYFWEGLVHVKVINGTKLNGLEGNGFLELVGYRKAQ